MNNYGVVNTPHHRFLTKWLQTPTHHLLAGQRQKMHRLTLFVHPDPIIDRKSYHRHLKQIESWTRAREHYSDEGASLVIQYHITFNISESVAIHAHKSSCKSHRCIFNRKNMLHYMSKCKTICMRKERSRNILVFNLQYDNEEYLKSLTTTILDH